jgi:hypothetical protein
VDVQAKVSLNPRLFPSVIGNPTKTVSDGANGISDIFFVPFALNWTFGDLQVNPPGFRCRADGRLSEGRVGQSWQKSLDV